jgi:hypothetical protein
VLWVRSGVVGDVPECSGITYRLVHTSRADSDVWESQPDCFFYGCASLQQGTRRSRDHQNRDIYRKTSLIHPLHQNTGVLQRVRLSLLVIRTLNSVITEPCLDLLSHKPFLAYLTIPLLCTYSQYYHDQELPLRSCLLIRQTQHNTQRVVAQDATINQLCVQIVCALLSNLS